MSGSQPSLDDSLDSAANDGGDTIATQSTTSGAEQTPPALELVCSADPEDECTETLSRCEGREAALNVRAVGGAGEIQITSAWVDYFVGFVNGTDITMQGAIDGVARTWRFRLSGSDESLEPYVAVPGYYLPTCNGADCKGSVMGWMSCCEAGHGHSHAADLEILQMQLLAHRPLQEEDDTGEFRAVLEFVQDGTPLTVSVEVPRLCAIHTVF